MGIEGTKPMDKESCRPAEKPDPEASMRVKLVDVTDAEDDEDERRLVAEAWPPFTAQLFDFLSVGDRLDPRKSGPAA